MKSLIPPGTRTICEPTPGIGNLTGLLQEYDVTAPDDFFLMDHNQRFDCIIMNPPFGATTTILTHAPAGYLNKNGSLIGYTFLKDCMKMSDNIIALVPWYIFHSDPRMRTIVKFGLKSITALPRSTFNYIRFQTVILELDRSFQGDATFKVYEQIMAKTDNQAVMQF